MTSTLLPHINAAEAIAEIAADKRRRTQTRAALTLAAALIASAELKIEWNLIVDGEPYLQPWTEDEELVRDYLRSSAPDSGAVVNRIRISTPDIVEEWRPVG